jgi:hypothetical protein
VLEMLAVIHQLKAMLDLVLLLILKWAAVVVPLALRRAEMAQMEVSHIHLGLPQQVLE